MLPFSNYNVRMYICFIKIRDAPDALWRHTVCGTLPCLKADETSPYGQTISFGFVLILFSQFVCYLQLYRLTCVFTFTALISAHITNVFEQLSPSCSYWSPLGPDNILNALF
jgi:hypothetical protein